ncbi:MAG: hypothetical protein OZ913_00730 [Ignavibacteriaceae bacterium]|jgi:hypothetical protein|nr:MAG: hypothetical protein EDM69_04845 [Chlorobiota bacterium]KXK04844.1 MAG: hypothetical protein UZ04_CHB001000732 [Chlorobi bacterium OLB4]MBV6397661.1 hypothetical protein [Ignavibacteria bacterium]MCC6885441.1 hypothetical protein [Ignavibacteriales bacterium]MCE7952792.1 hypothetical protein [Chlorobi bacterium CHB7]MDL1887040.1 hypothetical protein [Ignavibacteria bacterium CHB1]MEB2328812.1 hypothetical protein [Ignavibacteriaceae bacterium]OQY79028.1 MAG: hypothetical protein B6D4
MNKKYYKLQKVSMSEEEHWSKKIIVFWNPPLGFFDESAENIAHGLKDDSVSLAQAIERIDTYISRNESKISGDTILRLNKAKELLYKLFCES